MKLLLLLLLLLQLLALLLQLKLLLTLWLLCLLVAHATGQNHLHLLARALEDFYITLSHVLHVASLCRQAGALCRGHLDERLAVWLTLMV